MFCRIMLILNPFNFHNNAAVAFDKYNDISSVVGVLTEHCKH